MIFFSPPIEGRLIYLLQRCQQQRATSPWNRSAAAWRSHGEQAGSLAARYFFPQKLHVFFFLSPLANLFLYMPNESYISIAYFSILLLFFPNYITILSAPFPLCLSRLKGWTRGTHWPLQLTWARNTKSIYLLSSLPHYFSFMKSKPWRNVSHTFTWSVWHTQGSSLKTELHNNYLWCVHPANLSLHYTSTPPLQFMFQSHSTYAFCYLFSGQHL